MEKAIKRIARMEALFDEVSTAMNAGEDISAAMREKTQVLRAYMESGTWLADYELDENGALPQGMKRGVLSQDGLYDLLERTKEAEERR